MFIFLMLFSYLAQAETQDIRSLREQTFTRDNSYCRFGSKRVEFQIRSEASRTEIGEKKYGSYIFYYPKIRGKLLSINHDKLNTYRFFEGAKTLCSKSLGYALDKDKIAILFLKENRPFMDKLTLQIFDINSITPGEILDTEYTSDKTEPAPDGFFFRTYAEKNDHIMGSIKIQEQSFFYQDRDFPFWMKYTPKGFETSLPMSFDKFEWKKYFKDEKDFLTATGWDETEKKFKNTIFYVAVNHKDKKECILLQPTKAKILGTESWRCL